MPTATIGDNSNLTEAQRIKMQGFITEIEFFEAKKREISTDISEIYKAAKEDGFNTKAMRHNIKMRRMDAEERQAFENAVDAYTQALGALADTDLGKAAVAAKFPDVDTSNPPFLPGDDEMRPAADA